MARSLLQASLLVSFAMLLSRLSGLFREQALAARLGIGAQTDAVVVILTLPDLLTAILMSGGFSAALVPALVRADPAARVALLQRITIFTCCASLTLAVLIFLGAETVVRLLAPSLDYSALTGFEDGFAISLLAIPVASVIGVSAAWLQSEGRAAVPGLAVLAFNAV
uniref:lipid II flippase MurJ n=1 Tax=Roseobacter sp. TaxID=1907202 RepID=UPI0025CEEB85